MLFETERLFARHLTERDIGALQRVYGDADAMRWVGDGLPLDRAACARWIDVTQHNYATRGYGMTALVATDTGAVIGFCGIVHPGGQPEPEIKYALGQEYWGRGFATEAVRAMLDYGARTLGIREIIATVASDNTASHTVLVKCGMTARETRRNDDGTATNVFAWRASDSTMRTRRD